MNRQDNLGLLGYDSIAGSVVPDILKDLHIQRLKDPCIRSPIKIKRL
jgi:hypothetical protein